MHTNHPLCQCRDHLLWAEHTIAPVFVPGDRVGIHRGGQHIQVTVTVQIRGVHATRTEGHRIDHLFCAEHTSALICKPGNGVVITGCRKHIEITVAIQIRREYRPSAAGRRGDHPPIGKHARPLIRIPGHRVVVHRSHNHVGIAVAIQIRDMNRDSTIRVAGDLPACGKLRRCEPMVGDLGLMQRLGLTRGQVVDPQFVMIGSVGVGQHIDVAPLQLGSLVGGSPQRCLPHRTGDDQFYGKTALKCRVVAWRCQITIESGIFHCDRDRRGTQSIQSRRNRQRSVGGW